MSAKHEVEKAQMRKWVVTSILDSEHNYVNMLDVLLQVRKWRNDLSDHIKYGSQTGLMKTGLDHNDI